MTCITVNQNGRRDCNLLSLVESLRVTVLVRFVQSLSIPDLRLSVFLCGGGRGGGGGGVDVLNVGRLDENNK